MRPSFLMFSVIVHGGAIGAVAAIGAYAHQQVRRTPQVEIQATVASAPSSEQVATESDTDPRVLPEESSLVIELAEDPILPEPELHRAIISAAPPISRTELKVSLARIRPVEPPPVVETPEPPAEVVLPPPTPVSARVAASPRADNVAPPFPEHERALGREGSVVLRVQVDRFGLVVDVELVDGSHPGFNRAAMAAVRKWRFEPGTRDGVTVADEIPVTIEFRLDQ